MPSPSRGNRISSTSVGRHSAAALRRGEIKISDPISLPHSNADGAMRPDQSSTDQRRLATAAVDGTWPRRSTPPDAGARPGSADGQVNAPRSAVNRESAGQSAHLSTMSSRNSLKKRKSAGFRATIRSIFGSKRHRSSVSNDRSYHISDPGNLVPIRETATDRRVTRTPSQNITAVTQPSPLGSHSPFARPESKRSRSAEKSTTVPGHRRRNTLPSIVFSDQNAQQIHQAVQAINEGRAGETSSSDDQVTQIPRHLKRRSRSADALTELVASQLQSPANWRKSLIDQPLPALETKGYSAARKLTTSMSTTKSGRLNTTHSSTSLKPVQNFDFGLLADVSLEDRVKTLELKCFNFEYAIAGLQGYDLESPVPTSKPPNRRSIHDLFVETTAPPSSRTASGQGLTFLKSPTDSSNPSEEDKKQLNRSSAATIKASNANASPPSRSVASSPVNVDPKGDRYSNLLAMIKEERAARKQLEAQVLELQKQVLGYSTSQPRPFVNPSPESLYTEANESRARPLHRTPAFPRRSRNNLAAETSRFSISDTEESETDPGGFYDVYETPLKSKYASSSSEMFPHPTVEIF